MQIIIPPSVDLSPDTLAGLLSETALFREESIASLTCEPVTGQFGKLHQLFTIRIQYSRVSSSPRPDSLFLKFGKSVKEVFFYNTIAAEMDASLLLRCYYAHYDPAADRACLLLEDLGQTHFQTEWPLPPPAALCFRIVEELAKIHALWWQKPCLESEFRPVIPVGRSWPDRRSLALDSLPAFMDFLGDRLSPARRQVYERLQASSKDCWEVPVNAPHQTLIHGDMHAWNVFFPRDPQGNLVFFDWNMWDAGRPTDDLAYLLAVHWYPGRRSELEEALLSRYHRRLVDCGVSGYRYAEFLNDYRTSILCSLLIPVWQWQRGIQAGVWWSHLECVFGAYEDWKCRELLFHRKS